MLEQKVDRLEEIALRLTTLIEELVKNQQIMVELLKRQVGKNETQH